MPAGIIEAGRPPYGANQSNVNASEEGSRDSVTHTSIESVGVTVSAGVVKLRVESTAAYELPLNGKHKMKTR